MAPTSHFFRKSVVSDEASVKGKGTEGEVIGSFRMLMTVISLRNFVLSIS